VPDILPISIVIVTIAVLVLVATAITVLTGIARRVEMLSDTLHRTLDQFELTVRDANDLLSNLRELAPATVAVTQRFQRIAARAADLGSLVLDEVEAPARSSVALARGLRAGTSHLIERLARRYGQTQNSNHREDSHE
jgi:uncharacterized protein YoxC